MNAGKTARDENFPVGSILISKKLRPHVACFYNFARYADDLADNPHLTKKTKIAELEKLEAVLKEGSPIDEETQTAQKLRQSLFKTKVSPRHALDLLKAFKQDANEKFYQVWEELIQYCSYSAAPVGRYMLELHQEPLSTHWSSDRLCIVLQILNHLQDLKKDYLHLKRIYLPADFMKEFGVLPEDLAQNNASQGLRKVINKILDLTDNMLYEAMILPKITINLGLRIEIWIIIELAFKLSKKLRLKDPIKCKVVLNKLDWLTAVIIGLTKALFARKITVSWL